MLITKLVLKNWRNFREAELDLRDCSYLVGANATGKSNLLDAFRFLRDLSKGDVVELFGQVTYLHLIPHLLKNEALNRNVQIDDDPFGHGFLERIAHIPAKTRRQVIITTHSEALLSNEGIDTNGIAMRVATKDGTKVERWSKKEQDVVDAGFSVAQAVLPRTKPVNVDQLSSILNSRR